MSLAQVDGRALGSRTRLVVTREELLPAAQTAVEALLDSFDQACSRFREDSELTALNRSGGRPFRLSPILAGALVVALDAAQQTGGLVDPTVGRAMRRVGYDRDFGEMMAESGPIHLEVERVPGWEAIRFDPQIRICSLPVGLELDLGATGKGLAADLAAGAAVAAMGGGGALVSLGGDIAVAGTPPPGGWQVQISEDSGAALEAGEELVTITSGGIATSSTTVRSWRRGELILHHILDPQTGLPAQGPWRTATVAAANCAMANAASTAIIASSGRWLASAEGMGLPLRLVGIDGSIHHGQAWK